MSEPNPYEPPTGTTDDKSPRPRRNFKAAVGIVASAFIGFGVWALSPLLTGQTEPWDAGGYYILSLLIGGGIVGCCTPGRVNDTLRVLGACFGAWAGQLLAAGLFVICQHRPGNRVPLSSRVHHGVRNRIRDTTTD